MSRSKGGSVLLYRERYFYENSFLMDDQNETQDLLIKNDFMFFWSYICKINLC